MMTQKNSVNLRMLVLEMLLEENIYSHILVRDVLNKYNYLSQQEKSFIKRVYEGTLERRIELDYIISQYAKTKFDKMKPVICAILRMSVYQILYMDAVPDAAACNEAVKLTQKKGFATLKGFVNGVLRNIVRNKETITYPSLSVKYSMPEWIVDLWTKQLGIEKTELILAELLKEHLVTIRFRDVFEQTGVDLDTAITAVEKVLIGQGGRMEQHPYLPYAYLLSKTDDITKLPYYDKGAFVIQDVSSMLAVEAIGFDSMNFSRRKDPVLVIDICAAPGGKSMLAADLLKKFDANYAVISRDISENKVSLMQENFDRCMLKHVSAAVWDARKADDALFGKADIVIADVPCSGLGVIGKKRDIKYHISPDTIQDLVKLQKQILETAIQYLKPGGRLLFSTCTINQEENENQFAWLKNEKKLIPVPISHALPQCLEATITQEGCLQLLPGVHQTDGFFIAVLEVQSD